MSSLTTLNADIELSRVTGYDIETSVDSIKVPVINRIKASLGTFLEVSTIILGLFLKFLVDLLPLLFIGGKFYAFKWYHFRRLVLIAHHTWHLVEAGIRVIKDRRDSERMAAYKSTIDQYFKS